MAARGVGLFAPTPTPDALIRYQAALQPSAQADLGLLKPLPQYHLTVQVQGTTLIGVAKIIVPNPGPEVVFRLYPNMSNYNGQMTITQAQIDGQMVVIVPDAGITAIRLSVPPHEANEITVNLAFTVNLPSRDESPDNYTLFGWDGPILSLAGFYPMLAVQQAGEWVLDEPPEHGDVIFSEAALYQLDLTVPHDLVVAASGITVDVIDNPDKTRTWQIIGGPFRDITAIVGPFQARSTQAAGAVVTAYYMAGHEAAAKQILTHAAAALQFYHDLYGAYPYTEFDIVEAPLNVRGMEYSGMALIGRGLYEDNPKQADYLAFLVAHEVAHQWWYNGVGNNPYRSPWLDEALAEYSAFDYLRNTEGAAQAEQQLTGNWFIPFDTAAQGNIEGAIDRPVMDFNMRSYQLVVYTKGALFIRALRAQLGETMYRQVMQTYYQENRYRIATPQTFLATAQRVSGQNLNPLAEAWLR